jgi:hypothetical protein
MPSPFPGMDPYLEQNWGDVHNSLITYTRNALQRQLPATLRARSEERVVLETDEGIEPFGRSPDVHVVERRQPFANSHSAATTAIAEPTIVDAGPEFVTERYIQIIDIASGNRVVTIIEFLSPSNKRPGAGRKQYLEKQESICQSDTNLVEVDLIRTGVHALAVALQNIPTALRTLYKVCVRRATEPTKAEIYSMPLHNPLRTSKIPLRPTDNDVQLDLQSLIDQCYADGGYDDDVDYEKEPVPPLGEDDAVWADQLLRERGLRTQPKKPAAKRRRKPK